LRPGETGVAEPIVPAPVVAAVLVAVHEQDRKAESQCMGRIFMCIEFFEAGLNHLHGRPGSLENVFGVLHLSLVGPSTEEPSISNGHRGTKGAIPTGEV